MQLTVGKVRQKSSELLPLKELSPVHLINTEKQTECQRNACFFSYFWKDITGIAETVGRNSCQICI